jgi:hypothetical protein
MIAFVLWLLISPVWAASDVVVDSWLSRQPSAGVGTLVIQMTLPDGVDVQWPDLSVQGLRFTETNDPQSERFGTSTVIRREFRFSGQAGHYEIPALTVHWQEAGEAKSAVTQPIFVDVEIESLREGELADIVEPVAVWSLPTWVKWAASAAGLALMALMGAGVLIRRMGEAPEIVDVLPPDVVALRDWQSVRADLSLTDHERAVEISRIFRTYTEAALGFCATAWTTREIVNQLAGMRHLKTDNVPRAKRLLRATDRIKYAEGSAAIELFDALDEDLRGFVGSTRPLKWGESS